MNDWAKSEARKVAEAEALRMWPEDLHLGKFDGIIPSEDVKRRLLIQREAYVWGARAEFERAAAVVAEEPEWEYTWEGPDWCLDVDRVWDTPQECEKAPEAAWARSKRGQIVRRRKAGPWSPIPVEQEGESDVDMDV